MLDPSPLLTDLGNGGDIITVYSATYVADSRGDWKQTDAVGDSYPAVVDRVVAQPSSANDRRESMIVYTVMIFSDSIPDMTIGDVCKWTDADSGDHTLKLQGTPISCGPGAYQFAAQEITPLPSGESQPLSAAVVSNLKEKMLGRAKHGI